MAGKTDKKDVVQYDPTILMVRSNMRKSPNLAFGSTAIFFLIVFS
jgi:hypothetical protein